MASALLDLPVELRREIYFFALSAPDPKSAGPKASSTLASLFPVCKQINNEFREYLEKNTALSLIDPGIYRHMGHDLRILKSLPREGQVAKALRLSAIIITTKRPSDTVPFYLTFIIDLPPLITDAMHTLRCCEKAKISGFLFEVFLGRYWKRFKIHVFPCLREFRNIHDPYFHGYILTTDEDQEVDDISGKMQSRPTFDELLTSTLTRKQSGNKEYRTRHWKLAEDSYNFSVLGATQLLRAADTQSEHDAARQVDNDVMLSMMRFHAKQGYIESLQTTTKIAKEFHRDETIKTAKCDYWHGYALERLGEVGLALQRFQSARRICPGDETIRDAVERLERIVN